MTSASLPHCRAAVGPTAGDGGESAVTAEAWDTQNLVMMLLVPSDVLHPRRADEHYAAEADAARAAGHLVALVDHNALVS